MGKWRKTAVYLMVLILSGSQLTGCGGDGKDRTDEAESSEDNADLYPEIIGTYEAEDASFTGGAHGETGKAECSGGGYATGFQNDGDACVFTVEVPEDGFYDLLFSSSAGDHKENYVTADGEALGNLVTDTKSFTESEISRVYLTAGEHEIAVSKFWGWIDLDYLKVAVSKPIPASTYQVSAELVNENATENAKRLMSYLADNYGTRILSGQYCDTGINGKEIRVVNEVTGKKPAVLGLDFMEYTPSFVEHGSKGRSTDLAIQCWEQGGIVTFCWHWNAPSKYLTGNWYSGFYAEYTNIDLAKIMNGQDEEGYELLMADIDAIAAQLLILQEAGVPVLWRPLHEASGGWFWWGAAGAEPYIQLYRLLFDRLTNEYGLNNLIWVWNGQNKDWYPGDEYVDIIGEDIYPGERVYTSQINKYLEAVDYTEAGKMVVLSENGCVFDPELAVRDGAMWGFWCTWSGEFVAKDTAIFAYSEQYTEAEALKRFYENEAVITLEELPDLKTYPMRK